MILYDFVLDLDASLGSWIGFLTWQAVHLACTMDQEFVQSAAMSACVRDRAGSGPRPFGYGTKGDITVKWNCTVIQLSKTYRKIPKSLFSMVLPQLLAEFLQLCSVKFRVNLRCLIADSLQESSWSNAIEIFASNTHATYSLVMYNAVLAVAEWSQALQMLEDMSQGTVRQVWEVDMTPF